MSSLTWEILGTGWILVSSLWREYFSTLICIWHYRYVQKNISFCFIDYAKAFDYVAAKSLQSCLTLCNPIDRSPPGSPIPGILQTRTLEWVAISFSNAWKWKVKGKSHSRVRHFATPWTTAYQAPPSMGFSRQEYWSGVPENSLRDENIRPPYLPPEKPVCRSRSNS